MITIPISIFGIMRYQSLIFTQQTEAPEKILVKDKPLVISVATWTLMVVWIIYGT